MISDVNLVNECNYETTQSPDPSSTQSNVALNPGKPSRKRKANFYSCENVYDDEPQEDDRKINIITGFEDGILTNLLATQKDLFDKDVILEQLFQERFKMEMNAWHKIKEQSIQEVKNSKLNPN